MIPKEIELLSKKREELRLKGKYKEADKIRNSIENKGYSVKDVEGKTIIETPHLTKQNSIIAVFGSGETTSVGRKTHDFILSKIGKSGVKISIISTPAGFQPNVKTVHEEIADFFQKHLSNFHPDINIVYANNKEDSNDKKIVEQINHSDYIFIGPGSPTYAITHLKDSLLLKNIIEKVKSGTSLGVASAAAIAFSSLSLPVYEIYKVGTPLFWEKGLNTLSELLNTPKLSIIPHFNNNEGGVKNDTSFCFMGRSRFKNLIEIAPIEEEFLGIDENTAAVFFESKTVSMGLGKIKNFNSLTFQENFQSF